MVGHTADACRRLATVHCPRIPGGEVTCESGLHEKPVCSLWQLGCWGDALARATMGTNPKDQHHHHTQCRTWMLQTAGPPGRQSFLQTSNYNSILGRETGSDEAISIAIFCCIFFFRSLFLRKETGVVVDHSSVCASASASHRIVHRVSRLSSALLPSAKFAKENTRSRSRSRPRTRTPSRSRTMTLYASSTDRSLKFLV